MPLFDYRYMDANGKRRSGLIEAAGALEAKERLRAQKILVLKLMEKGKKASYLAWLRPSGAIREQHLITFTSQLSLLLIAGMPLYESLLCLEEQYRSEPFHPILLALSDQIKKGASLSEAMSQFPESFDTLYCAMVAAGESVGALETTLDKLAVLLSKERKLKKQLTTAMIYPAVLLSFSLVVCTLLLTFVIPSLEMLFEDRPVNGLTAVVMGLSRFLTGQWAWYLPALAFLVTSGAYFFSIPSGQLRLKQLWLRIPILKTLIIQAAMARFCRTMGTLLQGGVTIIQALQISRKVMRNPFLEAAVEQAEGKIVEGRSLSEQLKKSPLIPTLVPRMLAIGEEGGSTPLMFHNIADLYEEEVEKTLARVTALAQPVVLVIMGAIVGIIMLAVLLPLTDINAFL